jgi:hypothetical protein
MGGGAAAFNRAIILCIFVNRKISTSLKQGLSNRGPNLHIAGQLGKPVSSGELTAAIKRRCAVPSDSCVGGNRRRLPKPAMSVILVSSLRS